MVQINELRVGNLIQEGKIEQIDNSIDEVYYSGDGYYLSNFCCNINPIPLTEEWLFKFGFENREFSFDKEKFFLMKRTGKDGYLYQAHQNRFQVKSVHQLQNLYFALTQKELTI